MLDVESLLLHFQSPTIQDLTEFPAHKHIERKSRVFTCQATEMPKFLYYTIPKVSRHGENITRSEVSNHDRLSSMRQATEYLYCFN